jgi:hypothetical protein
MVILEPARGATGNLAERQHIYWPPARMPYRWWQTLRDPYAVCVDCGRLWPCPCHEADRDARNAATRLDWYASVLPGCCWACGRAVTKRHGHIEFPGENLLLLGGPPPVFHSARSSRGRNSMSCRDEAMDYELSWVPAGRDRAWRLQCAGHLFYHGVQGADWTCNEAGCPGPDAYHKLGVPCHSSYALGLDPAAAQWFEGSTNCGWEEYGHRCRSPR